ncbi:MAG: isoleucine--tRNA ligase [Flavobacteriales bacterium]|nr:isoleucine--tRNA ligase [Flavobacteriales bacterium]
MFPEYKNLDLAKICNEINSFWIKEGIFEKSIQSRIKNNRFVFYEGPPSANGMPGIHHVMARLIKDIFCRYKTLSGYYVERKAGWDTHGLPVELSVEKELNINKDDIGKTISVSEYNEACKKTVMKYTEAWNKLTEVMGYWVDVENPYITYENKYIETVWYLIKKLYDSNLIYKGYTIQPYSPAAGTGLSSHELNQPGCYKLVKDLSVVALFKLLSPETIINTSKKVFFMAWTTTPWTLFANTGLAVGKKINYVFLETLNPYTLEEIVVVCAEDCVTNIFDEKTKKTINNKNKKSNAYKVIHKCVGMDLIDLKYEQLLKYVKPIDSPNDAFRVVDADFVNTNDGTGIVHLAPTFGADDFNVAKSCGLPLMLTEDSEGNRVPIVDLKGCFVEGLGEFSGRPVKSSFNEGVKDVVEIDIVVKLKKEGLAFKSEKYEHSYPHCWRTDKPILYYPLDSWFIESTKCKEQLIEKNKQINWKPKSTGEGRFQNWLENINDWNLSRSRFWGIPLPIWVTSDRTEMVCVGSVEELKSLCENSVKSGLMKKNPLKEFIPGDMSEKNYNLFDLHKNCVDDIVLLSKGGKPMHREMDVIDVWFDSGSMPYAQWHYPFENKDLIDKNVCFPANFIAEGVDQTRGWFFTLHAIAVMCFNSVAFKNVISNGLVLDKFGQKMSKRLGNTTDPFKAIEEHGSDALRWYMITNSQPWDNLKFDINGVVEVKQKFFSTLYNSYSFFSLYANIDKFKYAEEVVVDRPVLDRWILSELNSLILSVKKHYELYEPTLTGRIIQDFVVDKLSNWYVRLCRRRFWKGEYDLEKISAYQTLYECLCVIAKISSPIAPFFMDRLFIDLNTVCSRDASSSVHLTDFPNPNPKLINKKLEKKMSLTKGICSLALSLRKREGIRVRQPLAEMTICLNPGLNNDDVLVDIVQSETNIKEVVFVKNTEKIVKKKLTPNFPVLGKKFGGLMKSLVNKITELSESDLLKYETLGKITIVIGEKSIILEEGDLIIKMEEKPGFLTAKNKEVLVSLNTNLSADLLGEGFARELVNRVQNIRKDQGFVVTDTINLLLFGEDASVILQHCDYVKNEVLAKNILICEKIPKNYVDFDFNNYKLYIAIENS